MAWVSDDSQFDMDFSGIENYTRPKQYKSRGMIPDDFHADAPFFFRHLLYRRQLRMNSIILICGQVRTGKSWLAIKMGELYSKLIGKKFDVSNQCSFDLIPFLKWSVENSDSVYILEEVGSSLPSTDWMSLQSKIFRNFTQTQGFRGNVLIMTLPDPSTLVKSVKNQVNYLIITGNQGFAIIYKMRMDYFREKMKPRRISTLRAKRPSKKNIDAYELMKKNWNNRMLKDDIGILERKREKAKQELNPWASDQAEIQPQYSLKSDQAKIQWE